MQMCKHIKDCMLAPKESKPIYELSMDELMARQLKHILCLADNEWITWYDCQLAEDGFVNVEIRTQNTTDELPCLKHNLIQFSFKKVDHKKYLEEKLEELGYKQPEIS